MIRILVVDDHPVVRSGIIGLLDTESDLEVVGEAASGEEALSLVADYSPDVVLMDLRMPGIGGVEATRRILEEASARSGASAGASSDASTRSDASAGASTADRDPLSAPPPPPRIIVFTTYEDDDRILEAIEAGASGYLLKAGPAEQLIAGIRSVAAGQTVLAPNVIAQLSRAALKPAAQQHNVTLTPREAEVLALVADGLSNPAIAKQLSVGESTVKTHLLHIFAKLEVNGRTRAVTRAQELGILAR